MSTICAAAFSTQAKKTEENMYKKNVLCVRSMLLSFYFAPTILSHQLNDRKDTCLLLPSPCLSCASNSGGGSQVVAAPLE